MNLVNIWNVATYESKTLFRSWFFRIFAILALLILFGTNVGFYGGHDDARWTFRAIAANLPYINRDELSALDVGRWEPRVALSGGADGLSLIRRMLDQVPDRLAPGGLVALEMGCDQGDRVVLSQSG